MKLGICLDGQELLSQCHISNPSMSGFVMTWRSTDLMQAACQALLANESQQTARLEASLAATEVN